jgi:hypothetical protein
MLVPVLIDYLKVPRAALTTINFFEGADCRQDVRFSATGGTTPACEN